MEFYLGIFSHWEVNVMVVRASYLSEHLTRQLIDLFTTTSCPYVNVATLTKS